ncbi:ABC transporter permease [Aureimonas fodinaquatilis]|uniref:ABC transporter permease n=2 Tax=Aureimonas fodinaquatilis TaxID=2565783 RepID=A0A5B0E145_9HYPH|nr:ABC transporter permease [Aureimonas fodinaquatilis]KAA0972022.1 ABC transporter permease [Aureimonas fodinaquatilis]
MARRILRLMALVICVAFAVFMLMKGSPIDPVDAYLGPAMAYVGPEQKIQIAAIWGLDRPIYEQFLRWAGHVLTGDLGYSIVYNTSVSEVLETRLGASLALTGLAWLLSGILGFVLGVISAAYEGRWLDRVIRLYCYVLAATPTFWLGMLMLAFFSVKLGWTPICCAGPIGVPSDQISVVERLQHLILPLSALTLFGVAQIALHSRAKMIEVLQSDYITFARAQGAGRFDIILRHGIRNAALPALTVLFASIGEILGGAILVEQVFTWPGLGRATVEAGVRGDVALLLAIAMLTTIIVSTGNMIADFLYHVVDPRLKEGV